jgi:hypothetical protein
MHGCSTRTSNFLLLIAAVAPVACMPHTVSQIAVDDEVFNAALAFTIGKSWRIAA